MTASGGSTKMLLMYQREKIDKIWPRLYSTLSLHLCEITISNDFLWRKGPSKVKVPGVPKGETLPGPLLAHP